MIGRISIDLSRPGGQGTGHSSAGEAAETLGRALELLKIPSHVNFHDARVATVSIWPGLVARCDDDTIRWISPNSSTKGKPLWTWAYSPKTAALRLAEHYHLLRRQPLRETLDSLGADSP